MSYENTRKKFPQAFKAKDEEPEAEGGAEDMEDDGEGDEEGYEEHHGAMMKHLEKAMHHAKKMKK
jgi:hypothetical protein